ncbi:M20/M25/M40 family metallo-hydrolase [Sphingobium boeckii]|uniref:Di/tripeptidase n=1 Tax=Sphingobium boeckii TaxID=1082345 RepID=A0A7W9EFH3_9SPHN|nr:di/tripeptidase [Sphingobium boeckii]
MSGDRIIAGIQKSPAYQSAVQSLDRDHDRFVNEIVALTEIPAPPFGEEKRGLAWRALLAGSGLTDIETDAEGNVMGLRRGTGAPGGKLVVISAHLDTVFPAGVDVKVKRQGTRLSAPGIGDDSRGLAALLAYARALDAGQVETKSDILFVATVGEEGPGDLRGMRYFFTKGPYRNRVAAFFSLDGIDPSRVTNGAVGSKRYRVTFKGPGGHSFGAFGIVNPMVAMSKAVTDLYEVVPPTNPKTTFAAAVTGGGTSVNSIPDSAYMEFDMRSESAVELAGLEKRFLAIIDKAVAGENAARSTRAGSITADKKQIGDRPAGMTAAHADIVTLTAAAAKAQGYRPQFNASSTDANMPISLGIPAVTIGSGGRGDRAHAPDEFIDVEKGESVKGLTVGLLALIATANAQP